MCVCVCVCVCFFSFSFFNFVFKHTSNSLKVNILVIFPLRPDQWLLPGSVVMAPCQLLAGITDVLVSWDAAGYKLSLIHI